MSQSLKQAKSLPNPSLSSSPAVQRYIQIVAIHCVNYGDAVADKPLASPFQIHRADNSTWVPIVSELYTEREWDDACGMQCERLHFAERDRYTFALRIVEVPDDHIWWFFGARYCENERDNLKVIDYKEARYGN